MVKKCIMMVNIAIVTVDTTQHAKIDSILSISC